MNFSPPNASATQGLGLRLRRDLSIHPQKFGGRQYWIVKDPVSLRYYKFSDEEHAILEMLNGEMDLEQIKTRFQQVFAPRRMTASHLHSFLRNLHDQGLLISDGPNQGQQLLVRYVRQRHSQGTRAFSNILAIRFPGIDPERLLTWLYPKLRICFSPWFFFGCFLLVASALGLVLAHADELRSRLPDFHEFISARNLVWLAVVLATTKILHEFGHALACKHFGGECHELGIMLLVFTPCLYCNVTDSWILRSRWQRIAISAAGIFVEIMLASAAAFLWWYSHPGLVNAICLNVMVVCAVGTLLLNGNPLLRYDGYFILSDLLELPNLWQDSRATIHRFLARQLLGVKHVFRAPEERRVVLAIYGVASMLYRVAVTIFIFVFLYKALAPIRLQLLAHFVVAMAAMGLLLTFVAKGRQIFEDPLMPSRIRFGRLAFTLCAFTVFAWGLFGVPLPCRVSAPAVLEPSNAQRVYVSVPGKLVDCVASGERVSSHQPLARLDDYGLRKTVARLTGDLERLKTRVRNLESRGVGDDKALAQLPAAREMLSDVTQRVAHRMRELQGLTLTAPIEGTVLPPPSVPYVLGKQERLTRWAGTPLDDRNVGCTLERGTLLCLVGDPQSYEAVLFVDEADIGLVRVGQRVRMSFAVAPGIVLSGTVYEMARRETQVVPRELAAGREMANRPDATGVLRPLKTAYEARVKLDGHDQSLVIVRGRAKIVVERQTASQRIHRLIRRTLTVPL